MGTALEVLTYCTLALILPASARADALTVLSLTPSTDTAHEQQSADPVTLEGHEAITLTFSRSVIALGSDWGGDGSSLPDSLTPFTLHPPVRGKLRWVTTSIARFDADKEWPPELELTLTLNPNLTSFDGRTVSAAVGGSGLRTVWRFVTPALSMYIGRVDSPTARALTNGSWSSSLHPIEDDAHELPADGTLELRFSSEVSLPLVGAALTLHHHSSAGIWRSFDPFAGGETPHDAKPSVSACARASPRCVRVALTEPLSTGALYKLTLPRGSRFHPDAGTTHSQLSVLLSGLVPFSFPFLSNGHHRTSYRRLRLWLRHGLSPATTLSGVTAQLVLTRSFPFGADRVPFTLSRPSASTLLLTVPRLLPETRYTLTVTGSPAVVDGFGLPLLPASTSFTTSSISPFFLVPAAPGGLSLRVPLNRTAAAAAFASAHSELPPAAWPVLMRGDEQCLSRPASRSCADPKFVSIEPLVDAEAQAVETIATLLSSTESFLPSPSAAHVVSASRAPALASGAPPLLRSAATPGGASTGSAAPWLAVQSLQEGTRYKRSGLISHGEVGLISASEQLCRSPSASTPWLGPRWRKLPKIA